MYQHKLTGYGKMWKPKTIVFKILEGIKCWLCAWTLSQLKWVDLSSRLRRVDKSLGGRVVQQNKLLNDDEGAWPQADPFWPMDDPARATKRPTSVCKKSEAHPSNTLVIPHSQTLNFGKKHEFEGHLVFCPCQIYNYKNRFWSFSALSGKAWAQFKMTKYKSWISGRKWSLENDHKMMSNGCPNDVQVMSKWCPNDAQMKSKMIPKWYANNTQTMSKRYPNDVQMMSKWCPNDVQLLSKWCADNVQTMSKFLLLGGGSTTTLAYTVMSSKNNLYERPLHTHTKKQNTKTRTS